jgi:outer membrane autotransporter protein
VTTANPIVLVRTAAGADNANFTLNAGSSGFATFGPSGQAGLVKGVWLYTLDNNVPLGVGGAGGAGTVLVSQAGPGAFAAPIVATAAQTIWYATAPWQDRQADLRDSALLAPGTLGSFTPGVWIKAVGDFVGRTDKIDPGGFTFDLDYSQDTFGLIGGIDGASHIGSGVGLIGVAGGYLNSQVNFDNHVGLADQTYNGWTASVYATYIQDQFFIDGQVKGDFLTLGGGAGGLAHSIGVTTWGGQIETGYRIPIGLGTLEPVGTLAYATTNIGDGNVLGTIEHFGDEQTFRGALGGRYSIPVVTNDAYMIKLAVDARVWDEFDGNNHATLISAGLPVTVDDNFSGVFGEVGGSLNLYSHDGHSSAFLSGSYKFKDDFEEGKVAIGYRYQFGSPPAPPPVRP